MAFNGSIYPPSNPRDERKNSVVKYSHHILIVIVVLLAGLSLLPGLGRQVMERQQELRVTLTARDMVETGRWMVPHYENAPRLKKPPLMYWIVAGTYKLFGTTLSVPIARLPNVLFSMLLIASVYYAGLIFLKDKYKALLASVLTASSFIIQRSARVAETDISLILFTTLACIACFKAMTDKDSVRWWLLAGLFSGVGFMIKGPAAIVMPLLASVVFMMANRLMEKPSGWSWNILYMLLIFAAVALPWYLLLRILPSTREITAAAVGSEMKALVGGNDLGHPGPFYYYLFKAPAAFMPWGLLIFPAVCLFWKNRKQAAGHIFVLGWFVSSLILLSMLHNKQQHYALLLLPSAVLITAHLIFKWINNEDDRWGHFVGGYHYFLLILAAVAAAAALISPFFISWLPRIPMLTAGLIIAAFAVAGAWCMVKKRAAVLVIIWAVVVVAVYAYIFVFHPFHRPETLIPEFAAKTRPYIQAAPAAYHMGRKRAAVEFYVDRLLDHAPLVHMGQFWRRQPVGTTVAVISKTDREDPFPENFIEPVIDMTRGNIQCRLFMKE